MAAAEEQVKPTHKVIFEILKVPGRTKPVWNEIGVAFVNSDGSMNLKPHRQLKPGGNYQIRDPRPREVEAPKPDKVVKMNRNKK